jgi:hypothetical protein
MKTVLLTCVALTVLALPGLAQSDYNGHGFGYFGVDLKSDRYARLLTAGAGGEAFLWKGLAAGADIGYVFPSSEGSDGFGLLSVNPAYHFTNRSRTQKLVPFVTAGYALGFRSGTANFFNWGGGVTYWPAERLGVRLEVRDYRQREDSFLTVFRVGLTWR